MVHNDNTEWEEFGALLDEVVPDTSDATQSTQSDAYHASPTQAQDELQSGYTDEDDSDLEEVEVDQFAMKAETENESGTTAQHHNSTHEALAAGPVVAEAPFELSSGSSSTATTQSAAPQSEAAANRARATEKGYLARRRAARKSASLQAAKKEAASQAGSETPRAPSTGDEIPAPRVLSPNTTLPLTTAAVTVAHTVALPRPQTGSRRSGARASTNVSTPSASSSSALAIPAPSSSRAATSPATLPPPPPLPVGPTGRRQLWEETLRLGLPRVKAEYRVTLPPARPASAPVIGAASAGPVPSVAARHQSAPVASTSRGKRSREQEDRGDEVIQKKPKVNNAQSRKRAKASAQSPSGGTHRPQWIPYAASQAEPSRLYGSAPAARQDAPRKQQPKTRHEPGHQVPQLAQSRRAGPSTETSRETNGTPMNRAGRERSVPSTMRLPPPPTLQRPQVTPGAGSSYRTDERTSAQTYARPVIPSSWYDPSLVPNTFSRAVVSASAPGGTRNRARSEVHGNATVPQQRQPEMPQAGASRTAYEQLYDAAGLQRAEDPSTSAQAYAMPVPSGWNDPAAIPRIFARASATTRQMDDHVMHHQIRDAPVAYAVQPQQQMGRPVPSVHGGGMAPRAEQLPSVDAPGSRPVYNRPYAPPMQMQMPAGWNSSAQPQAMSGREMVPAYLTMYAPPNYPPPGWSPQAPVYEPQPSAQRFSSGQGSTSSAYGYGYDF